MTLDVASSPRSPAPARRHLGNRCLALATLLVIGGPCIPAKAQAVLEKAVFAKKLAKNQEPITSASAFFPTDTVYLSLQIKGRPSQGIAAAKFYFRDQMISDAQVDLASVNSGVLFSIGSSTYAGFSLTPNKPLPISDDYRVETSFNGKPWGTYRFRVVPPPGAIPSRIVSATLAKGVDSKRAAVGPTKTFGLHQPVYLALRGALGTGTGVEVNWFVSGKRDPAGTKSITASKNVPDVPFYFAFLPAGGWPAGKHEAVLTLNGKEAGRYSFTTQ